MDFPFKDTNLSAIHNRNLQQRTVVAISNNQVSQPFIKQHFAKFGKIENIKSTEGNTHYILFENQNQATEALKATGQNLNVQLYQTANAGFIRSVCIVNVPLDTNEQYVQNVFEKFGKINYVKLNKNLDGELTGKGTVSFCDESTYQQALKEGSIKINFTTVYIQKSFDEENSKINTQIKSSFKKKRERRISNKQKKETQQSVQNIKQLKFANKIDENMVDKDINLDNVIQIQRRRMTKKIKKLKKNKIDVIKGINKFKARVKKHHDQILFQKPSEMKERRERRVKVMEKNRKQGSKLFKPKNNNNLSQILE